jgi:competence protein ComEA
MFTQIVLGAALAAALTASGPAPQDTPAKPAATREATAPAVNLNSATVAELEGLPGIGPATAARIVEYRQKNGPFKRVEDLMNVKGIGEKSFLKLKPLLTVAAPRATN